MHPTHPPYKLHSQGTLVEPVLIVHLRGWIDASGAAAAAMDVLENETEARTVAEFNRDMFVDYRARRPTMELRDGVSTQLIWPTIELMAGKDRTGRDVLLLTGHEPDTYWETFTEAVTCLALELGVRKMVGLGAYPFACPHSRPPRLSCSSPDESVISRLHYLKPSIDVPAGMAAALEHACTDRGIASLGIWAQVPHYVSNMSFPAASVALIAGLQEVAGVVVDASSIRSEALIQRQRLDELVASNAEHRQMVAQLETAYDQSGGGHTPGNGLPRPAIEAQDIPSAEELAQELEAFLRDQD
jgi:PAC2 family